MEVPKIGIPQLSSIFVGCSLTKTTSYWGTPMETPISAANPSLFDDETLRTPWLCACASMNAKRRVERKSKEGGS